MTLSKSRTQPELNHIIGIDASRMRFGGGITHILGILKEGDPTAHGIREVHLWSYKSLLDALPDFPWLKKHNPPELEMSLIRQLWWQFHCLAKELKKSECDILFSPDATTVCGFRPSVVMSQDMLLYEPGQVNLYRLSVKHLRLIVIGILQTRSMKQADGVIFLTKYAAEVIQRSTGNLECVSIIPHGIGADFRQTTAAGDWSEVQDREIRCLYISHAVMYKHQWVVVRAIGELRRHGHRIGLLLVGGGSGRARKLMDEAIAETDPQGEFILCREFVPHAEIPSILAKADLFVFASSCENMPITLLEAMAAGLPIACSDRGPMPEVLQDGGVFFDPENSESICSAIERIIEDRDLRMTIAKRAEELSRQYTWEKCAKNTWPFLKKCAEDT